MPLRPVPAPPASFVGRTAERRRVARLWDRSRLVVVVGPAGVGKTALARHLVDELAPRKAAAVTGAFLDGAETALGLSPLPTGRADRALRLANVLDRRRLVLLVEDVHGASLEEQTALRDVAAHLRKGHLLVTSRAPLPLGELGAATVVVELGPLPLAEAEALVRDLLDRFGRADDAAALARASAGNPQWCGLLAAGGGGGPRLGDRIAELPRAEREALARLAVFGAAVDPARLGVDPDVVSSLARRFLVDRPDGELVSLHDLVREAVLAGLDPGERAAEHRRAAEACRAARDVAGLLRHLEAAGDRTGLAAALLDGADAWLASQLQVAEYLRLADWLEAGGAALAPRLELRRALCQLSLGRTAEAERAFARVPAAPGDAGVLFAAVGVRIARERDAPARVRRALLAGPRDGAHASAPPTDRGDLLLASVWELMHEGAWDDAIGACRAALEEDDPVDELSQARAARILGELYIERGEVDGARRSLADAEARATRLGSANLRRFAEGTWVQLHVRHGSVADARRRLARMEALTTPAEASREDASRTFRRAELLARRGRLADAVETLEACESRHPVLAIGLRCSLWSYLAAFAAESGDDERAARAARALLSVPRGRRPRHYGIEAPLALARIELGRGRLARAARRARIAVEVATRAGLFERGTRAATVLAEIEVRAGRPDAALTLARGTAAAALALEARPTEARARIAAAEALLALDRPAGAADEATEALRVAEAAGHALLAARARIVLGRSALTAGDLGAALRLGARARTGLRGLDAPAASRELEALQGAIEAAPAGTELWMDARSGRVVVDGRRRVELGTRPVLARLLAQVLQRPQEPLDKEVLFREAWRLPYRPARDATVYKSVARLGQTLDPDAPHRFLRWDADGRLVLTALRTRLVPA